MPKIFTNETCAIAAIYAFADRHPEKAEAMLQFAREHYGVGVPKKQPAWYPTFRGRDQLERRLHGTLERPMVDVINRILERAPRSDYGDKRIVIGTFTSPDWGTTRYGVHNDDGLLFYAVNSRFPQHHQKPYDALSLIRPWVSAPQYEWELRQMLEKQLEALFREQLFVGSGV